MFGVAYLADRDHPFLIDRLANDRKRLRTDLPTGTSTN
jgi:hypothetical protein